MNLFDLTEKLKELLMRIGVVRDRYFHDGDAAAIAKQLAPEIEKMKPRWIPVSERLPEKGQVVDVWVKNFGVYERQANVSYSTNGSFDQYGGNVYHISDTSHWMPTPKGPMG